MSARQVIGLIGCIALFIGVFAPIVKVPVVGDMNFFNNGKGDGVFIVILASLSFIAVMAKKFSWLWLTSFGCLIILGVTFFNFQSKIADAKRDLNTELAGNPFRGLADVAIDSIQLQWGWAVLLVGSFMILGAAIMKDKSL